MATATIENKALMSRARESLKGRWGLAIGGNFVYLLILLGVQAIPLAGGILSLLISGALVLGFNAFMLAIARKEETSIGRIFCGFDRFGVALGTYLLQTLFVILWLLLLIVPGIIAAYSYAMTFYVLADNEDMQPLEAIKTSKAMMQGNKWKLFFLSCRFIGWALLCILTLGIGFLWFFPYMSASVAQFYLDVKGAGAQDVSPGVAAPA